MKGIPTVPNVQTATRVSPKVWRCTTCHRLNDTRKADQRCGHVPPWVEADRAAEADLARFRSAEQTRMAAKWWQDRQREAGGQNRLDPATVAALRAAEGTPTELAKRFGVSRATVVNYRRDLSHGAKRFLTGEQKARILAMTGNLSEIARAVGVSRSAVAYIKKGRRPQ